MNISVLGCGRWATFLAWYLNKKHKVVMWGRENSKHLAKLISERKNEYLELPEEIELTSNLEYALNSSDTIVISILTNEFRNFLTELTKFDLSNKTFVICMKGIESSSGMRLTQIMQEFGIDKEKIAVWVGPGHVQNFVSGIPNCMLMASYNYDLSKKLVSEFSSPLIRFYIGKDVLGAEIGASAKNVLGIAAGMLDGKDMGCLKGALMARGTREFSKLIDALGGNKFTPYGLSCLGDFEATLFSSFSQNHAFGMKFIKGEQYEKSAEGVGSIEGFKKLADKMGVDMPITNALYKIVFLHANFSDEFEKLILRGIKEEF